VGSYVRGKITQALLIEFGLEGIFERKDRRAKESQGKALVIAIRWRGRSGRGARDVGNCDSAFLDVGDANRVSERKDSPEEKGVKAEPIYIAALEGPFRRRGLCRA